MINHIYEIYPCIQGEGIQSGTPQFLIRFCGCNLRCQFSGGSICSSAHASWMSEKNYVSISDITKALNSNPNIKRALITGGEPLLHVDELLKLIQILRDNEMFISIETNSTIYSEEILQSIDFISLSPKLKNSTPILNTLLNINGQSKKVNTDDMIQHEVNRKDSESVARKYIESGIDYQLKFVISPTSDITEILNFVESVGADREKVVLIPEGNSNEQLNKHRIKTMELCVTHGFNYSDRLQIILKSLNKINNKV